MTLKKDELILEELASDPATPASGKWSLYPKAGGLYLIDDAGTVLGPIDPSQYLTKDGLKEWTEQGSDPTTPASGKWKLYFKAGGLYLIDDAGVVIPIKTINKNILPNGGFSIAQRGAGPFTSATLFPNNDDVYLIDGCVLLSDGNDIVDKSRVEDTDFVSGYKIRLDVETANKKFGVLFPIENKDIQEIRKSGKASLQFKAKCTGASMSNVRAYVLSWNSTADTITSDVISAWGAAGANPTLVANWTAENTAANIPVTTTIALNKIEDISVDTASVANLAVLIVLDDTDATVGDYLEIGDVKLENGSICTAFENPKYDDALHNCRRHFEAVTLASGQSIGAGLADSTSSGLCFYNYKVAKRIAAHTFSYSALSDFTLRYTGGGVTVVTAFVYGSNGIEGATIVATATGTPLTGGQAVQLRAANANAVLYFSAEL